MCPQDLQLIGDRDGGPTIRDERSWDGRVVFDNI